MKSLYTGKKEPGTHSIYIECDGLRNGIYFVRMQTKDWTDVRKLAVTR